jgi:hypothetical protein
MSVGHEAQQQEALHHGKLRMVEKLPGADVGHVHVTVHTLALHREGAQHIGISSRNGSKGYYHRFVVMLYQSIIRNTCLTRMVPNIL